MSKLREELRQRFHDIADEVFDEVTNEAE